MLLVVLAGVLFQGAETAFVRLLLLLVLLLFGGFILSVVFHTFMAVQFRCVGMLGRYNPGILHMLPDTTSAALPVCVILGGIVVSGAVWGTVIIANL
jgi:hypothetical protein